MALATMDLMQIAGDDHKTDFASKLRDEQWNSRATGWIFCRSMSASCATRRVITAMWMPARSAQRS